MSFPCNQRFAQVFDQLAGVPGGEPDFAAELLDTAMLRPVGLATASAGFLLMSCAAAIFDGHSWTKAWLIADLVFLVARLIPAILAWRKRAPIPAQLARFILCAAFIMFTTFGIGCAASFASGIKDLQIGSAIAIMGLLAGLATRWAAVPRMAAILFVIIILPMSVSVALVSPFAAVLLGILCMGTVVLTLQNNRTLIIMLRAERRARALATADPLTGVLNRAGLDDVLGKFRDRPATQLTILYIDLNKFKNINDQFGHAVGDKVLVSIASRLATLNMNYHVARIGGDEFALVTFGQTFSRTDSIINIVIEVIERPITVFCGSGERREVQVGASVGWAVGSSNSNNIAELLEVADRRLYLEKTKTKSIDNLSRMPGAVV